MITRTCIFCSQNFFFVKILTYSYYSRYMTYTCYVNKKHYEYINFAVDLIPCLGKQQKTHC